MAVFLQRDTVLHITPNDGDTTAMGTPVVYRVPVLEGFSFSQTTNSSDISLSEMESTAGVSRRGRRVFNDSLAPAEWSFSTYIRPFLSGGGGSGEHSAAHMHAVDEVLWNALLSRGHPQETGTYPSAKSAQTASLYTMTAANSNKSALNTLTMEFAVSGLTGGTTYVLDQAVVNGATVTFDVDGIATVEWTGFAATVTMKTANSGNPTTATILEGQQGGDTNNFIRNRLTTLAVDGSHASNAAPIGDSYALTLTGGTITIDNGITYLTPDTLGTVNSPLAHVTGPRNISGSFTCYLATGSGNDSRDFFNNMTASASLEDVTNVFDLSFAIGGASAPKATSDLDTCHVEVPSHAVDEVISLETNFHSLPSDLDSADDFGITFVGPAVT